MTAGNRISGRLDGGGWIGEPPDPVSHAMLYDGVVWRRVVAYAIDLAVLAVLAVVAWLVLGVVGILSFGLLAPLIPLALALLPIAYHALLVGGPRSATLGMRLLDVEVRSFAGDRPTFWQAALMAVLFYATLGMTGSLILLVVLFNARHRTVHDFLSGTIVVRARAAALSLSPPRTS